MYARERLVESGEERGRRGSPRRVGARPGGAGTRIAAARPEAREPARGPPHPARAQARRTPCASASRCCRSGCDGSSSRRRSGSSPTPSTPCPTERRCAPRRCSPPRRSTSAAARSPHGIALAERATPSPSRSETRSTSGARCSSSASSGSRATRPTWRCRGSSAPSQLARRRELRRRRGDRDPLARRRELDPRRPAGRRRLLAESIERFRALEGSSDTIPSPLNIAEIRTTRLDGRSPCRHVFEDTLQPLVEISCARRSQLRAREPGRRSRAHEATSPARARCSTRARRASRLPADDAGLATVLVRRAYLALAEDELAEARAHLEVALELRAGLSDRRGRGLVLSGLGLVETAAANFDEAEALSRRGARNLQACRRPLGPREHAMAHRRPRPRAWPPRRGGGGSAGGVVGARRDTAAALDREHARGARRGRAAARRHRARVRLSSRRRAIATPRATTSSGWRRSRSGLPTSISAR